jgi:hypothetical protein
MDKKFIYFFETTLFMKPPGFRRAVFGVLMLKGAAV